MEKIEITEAIKVIIAKRAMLNGSSFQDVAMMNVKIVDANLSGLEIEDAQLGGAYFHNIGMPHKGHPMYNPEAKQRPLKFEDCDLNSSIITNCNLSSVAISDCNLRDVTISDCNLSGVAISDCDLSGTTIDGILIDDLLSAYKQAKK